MKGYLSPFLAILLLLASVQPAAATLGDRTASTGNYSATVLSPFWTGNAHYNAHWYETQIQDAGQTWWQVSKIELGLYVLLGGDCKRANICSSFPLQTAKIQFLNSSGSVLYTISSPSAGSCWDNYLNPADAATYRCAWGPYQISSSANRIRFTWEGAVVNRNGYFGWWPKVTRTYYL